MSSVNRFVEEHAADIVASLKLPSVDTIREAEEALGFSFGQQLKFYLKNHGFLIYKFVELYGLNENQKMYSDLVVRTQKARENYGGLNDVVIIESMDGGNYIVCDGQDNMHEYLPMNEQKLTSLGLSFEDYVVNRFNEIA
ncbi:SMI1/KNR4 family protein [Sporosarcina sp. FSL K6-5500]|uniref:SMI1/KNR4 family protein n=1 Tax=Sporosarcina sp. FSL K6-5500 TaxID=2921558 RepID=UPI0030F53AEE